VLLEFKYKIIESYIDNEDNIFIKDLNNSNQWTTYSNELQSQGLADICLTPACIEAGMLSIIDGIDLNALYVYFHFVLLFFYPKAHILLSHIDESVSPCDDFYK
jgi:hypothetical protein